MAETLAELKKQLDEERAKQRREDGFAGAAPGNDRPGTDEEVTAAKAGLKKQIHALRERDQVVARQRAAAEKAG